MQSMQASVVVIGSGMGGGTTALALARRGIDASLITTQPATIS